MRKFLSLICLLILLIGCSSADPGETAVADDAPVRDGVQVVLVNSVLTTGPTRFAIALLEPDGQFIHDATVEFQYFDLSDPDNPQPERLVKATTRQTADGFTTIYTDPRNFAQPGTYGLEVRASFPDGTVARPAVQFEVSLETASLPVWTAVPAIKTPTAADVEGDYTLITSAQQPIPDLYEISLDEALENGRLTLLYFATPAYCQTRLCGPGYGEFALLEEQFGDEINFIHVEVFEGLPDPSAEGWPLAESMVRFGLTTEPWLYIIDAEGVVAYRIEGLFTAEEIAEVLPELAQ